MTTEGRENESAEAAESDAVGARLSAVLPGWVRRRTGAGIFQKEEQDMKEVWREGAKLFWDALKLENMSFDELNDLSAWLGALKALVDARKEEMTQLETVKFVET